MDRWDGAVAYATRVPCTGRGHKQWITPLTVVNATPGRRSRTASRASRDVDARSGTRLSCAVIEYWPGPDATGCAASAWASSKPSD